MQQSGCHWNHGTCKVINMSYQPLREKSGRHPTVQSRKASWIKHRENILGEHHPMVMGQKTGLHVSRLLFNETYLQVCLLTWSWHFHVSGVARLQCKFQKVCPGIILGSGSHLSDPTHLWYNPHCCGNHFGMGHPKEQPATLQKL